MTLVPDTGTEETLEGGSKQRGRGGGERKRWGEREVIGRESSPPCPPV